MAHEEGRTDNIKLAEYRARSEFRYQIRRFFRFSEKVARSTGLEPKQYELLLAIKGLPRGMKATIGNLAERLQVRHNSAVELIDRLEKRGLLHRNRDNQDRRQVLVVLTNEGEKILRELSVPNRNELRHISPELVRALSVILNNRQADKGSRKQ